MKLFSIDTRCNIAEQGSDFIQFEVKPGLKIPAIQVGEEGRNRRLGILPVEPQLIENKKILDHCTGTKLGDGTILEPKIENGIVLVNPQHGILGKFVRFEQTVKPDFCWNISHPEYGWDHSIWHGYVYYLREIAWQQAVRHDCIGIGQTQSGRPKLVSVSKETDGCVIIVRSCIPKRTHDKVHLFGETTESAFPGRILVEGKIADGMAGYVGSAMQYVVAIEQPGIFHIQNLHLQKWRWDGIDLVEITKSEAYL